MSFIKELKRRNVIRVAIVYAVVAWLLIEITATTFPILNLPDWSVTLVTVIDQDVSGSCTEASLFVTVVQQKTRNLLNHIEGGVGLVSIKE